MTNNDVDQAITLYFDSREHGQSLPDEQDPKGKNKQIYEASQQVRAPIPPKQDTLIEKGHLPGIGRLD